jgi:AraC family transcriptional regulator of adaptative response/methylated-DNA-[protein]-cysteine methyltransferase
MASDIAAPIGPQESGGAITTRYYNCGMTQANHYTLIADMLHWLTTEQATQPGLQELAQRFGLSEFYLQRTFQEFTGVTPKQFLKFLTKEQAIARLQSGSSVFEASLDSGLSGPGRLHDLLISTEAITPGEARRAGLGVDIHYGLGTSPFGECLLGWTRRGVCFLAFCQEISAAGAQRQLQEQWPAAQLIESQAEAKNRLRHIFARSTNQPIRVWLHGSPFQLKVWQALLQIPEGGHCNYGQIAHYLGRPKAARAVGTAIGANPVSWLIPCHRVITSLATPGGYRWGIPAKMAMIGVEAAHAARRVSDSFNPA